MAARWLGVVGEVLLTGAVVVVLLLVWLLWWTDRSGAAAARGEVRQLEQVWGDGVSTGLASSTVAATPDVRQPAAGKAFAVLYIPRFGADWQEPVLQGTDSGNLRKGVGHYGSAVMPGVVGNFAVAGHRTTWGHPFGEIEQLRAGDLIVVETSAGWFTYRVTGHQIVRPGDHSVIAAVPGHPGQPPRTAMLTLTTCHPKYSARQRWIVHAELETSLMRAAGPLLGVQNLQDHGRSSVGDHARS